ncbi:hypothetical protein D6D22_08628 [Aureobasidium pullulans]|uniref:Uncharacterized protein n=1 Tax=Aureobasidium pullulans TaxID=5580 RepID=A0A4V4IGC6_AURPU|nr:hypothetical protein D6D22_08628 [Aureobasidium pullulans]
MFNEHTTSTQVVTKVYGVEQGAPWVVHEVFVSDPQPLTPHPVLTFLKKPVSDSNYPSRNRSPHQNTFQTSSKTTEGLAFKFPLTVTFPEHQSVNQLGNRRTEELYDQASSYLKNQRLVPDTKSRRVASQTSISARRTPAPPTTTTMAPRGLTNEEIEEDLVTMGLRLRTKKRKRSSAILPWRRRLLRVKASAPDQFRIKTISGLIYEVKETKSVSRLPRP